MPQPMRLFKHPNGYWYCEFRRGKSRSLKTKSERSARSIFKEIEREWLHGRLVDLDKGKDISLAEFTAEFFEKHTDIGDKVKDGYELALRLLADSIGGSTRLSRVPNMLNKFISDCRTRGVKTVSINTYLRHIRTPLNKAYKWGYLEKKPDIEMLRTGKQLPRILSMQEIAMILRYARRQDFEMYRVVLFALWTGCRRKEIYNARWEKVSRDSITIHGKGNRERSIPMLPMAEFAMGTKRNIGRIFCAYRPDTISHKFKSICRSCKIQEAHFHNLRHSAATHFLAAGLDIKFVSTLLGHASVTTTEIYAKVLQEKLDKRMREVTALKLH